MAVLVMVPALVAWHILPHAIEEREYLLVIAVAVGFLVPLLIEQASSKLAEQTDNVALIVGLSGLALHALLEGAAFAGPRGMDPEFGIAVALHRVPVGLIIWWLIHPRFGWKLASAGIGALILANVAGFGIGHEVLPHTHGGFAEIYEAFVSGSLMHVVFHQGRHDHNHEHEN